MTTVADVMTRSVVTVSPDASLREALTQLATEHISGAAVTDGHGRLLGAISRSDLLEAEAEAGEPEAWARQLDITRVQEIMSAPALTIAPEADLKEAALAMEYGDVHRLFVVKDEALVGVVSRSDVNRALATGKAASP
jgi:CBS domain-containing protein